MKHRVETDEVAVQAQLTLMRALKLAVRQYQELGHRIEEAKRVLTWRAQHSVLHEDDVTRILNGEFLYYVGFSERWRDRKHPKLANAHPDNYVVIEHARSLAEAKQVANRVLGSAHNTPVYEAMWQFGAHPKGELLRIDAHNYTGETSGKTRSQARHEDGCGGGQRADRGADV